MRLQGGRTPLMVAAERDALAEADRLIEAGADLDAKTTVRPVGVRMYNCV